MKHAYNNKELEGVTGRRIRVVTVEHDVREHTT